MTLRTAPVRTAPLRTPPRTAPGPTTADTALDEALEHIGDLAERLWAVRRQHTPRPGLLRSRCSGCGHAVPCPTLRAASAA